MKEKQKKTIPRKSQKQFNKSKTSYQRKLNSLFNDQGVHGLGLKLGGVPRGFGGPLRFDKVWEASRKNILAESDHVAMIHDQKTQNSDD